MAEPFTPEQVAQILEEFFKVVGTRQYIGARYVPIFGRKDETSIIWDNSAPYEPLTIVLYQGNSYTSRQYVPTGVDILNQEFWALTGNYNAQVEAYRTEVLQFSDEIEGAVDKANQALEGVETLDTTVGNITSALPLSDFSAQSTVKDQMDNLRTELNISIDDVADALPLTTFNRNNTVASKINAIVAGATQAYEILDNITAAMPLDAFSAENTIADAFQYVEDTISTVVNPLRETVEHDTIFNKKYIGKTIAPIVDGSWYAYYDSEHFNLGALCVVNDNVYFGSRNGDDTRAIITMANRSGNTFNWTREFSSSHIKHVNSMAWDTSRNRFMIAGEVGYGIRIADASFNTVSAASELWPFTTWAGRIAYDRVTNYGYVIDEGNNPGLMTRHLYWLQPNANAFERMCDIELPTYNIQDICVRDDMLFMTTTTNAWYIYHIDREQQTCTFVEGGNFSNVDANQIYYFGELEGCDFDENGNLYVSFISGAMGVITRVPYQNTDIVPINRSSFQALNATITTTNRNTYRNDLSELKSISELTTRAFKNIRTVTYSDTIVEYAPSTTLQNIEVVINSTGVVTFNGSITCAGGFVSFVNLGTMVSNARELFTVSGAAAWLSVNCNNTSTNTFNSTDQRIASSNTYQGGFVYIHNVPSGYAGKVNAAAAVNRTLYGFGTTIGLFS